MALKPKISDVPRIALALRVYKVSSYVTGVMLLLLVVEMILKYTPIHREIYFGNAGSFVSLVPWDPTGLIHTQASGFDVSTGILIAHGWLYVVYLFCDFRLWSLMRWNFTTFVAIALGGVVPFLSFFVEHFISKRTLAELDEVRQTAAAKAATAEVTN
jgi:integral membrane protein